MRKIFIALIIGMLSNAIAMAASGWSYADNQVFSEGYIDLDNMGALSLTQYPVGSPGREMIFETSYARLYNLSELTDSRAAGAVTIGPLVLGSGFSFFGDSDYFGQWGISLFGLYRFRDIQLGTSIACDRISFGGGYESLSKTTINGGLSWRHKQIRIFGTVRNINEPRYYTGGVREPLESEMGVSFKSSGLLDNQARLLFIKYRKPSALLAQGIWLADYLQVNWSFVLRPARLGVGLKIMQKHFGFGYTFSHHPVLGETHRVSLMVF